MGEKMKRLGFLIFLIMMVIGLTGCEEDNETDIINKLDKKIEKTDGYQLTGTLKLLNNEETYLYNVEVSYSSEDKFRVSLINQNNNHEQIILRNEDGVYVLTPSLNKSFKFESEWPYNNSQIYILQTLIDDIKSDKNYSFEKKNNQYIFKTVVDYPNNSKLIKQKIYLDKKLNLKKVEVLDRDNKVQMSMKFDEIKLNKNFKKNYFDLDSNMKASQNNETFQPTSKIEDSLYPMYLPENTYLEKEDKVSKEDGERLIMTFSGDSPFMIIQETVSVTDDYTIIPVSGEPTLLPDTIAALADNELSWISDGIEYYMVSSELESDQLVNVANSINVASVIDQK